MVLHFQIVLCCRYFCILSVRYSFGYFLKKWAIFYNVYWSPCMCDATLRVTACKYQTRVKTAGNFGYFLNNWAIFSNLLVTLLAWHHCQGKLLALPANIRLRWKQQTVCTTFWIIVQFLKNLLVTLFAWGWALSLACKYQTRVKAAGSFGYFLKNWAIFFPKSSGHLACVRGSS